MSMYNMLFGMNPNSDIILAILGLKKNDVERFRNCGFMEDGIFIYTRTGGGNRDDYPNDKLTSNSCYLRDNDDDYDCTYATYYFKFPDEIRDDIIQFQNVRENGMSGKFIQWILRTIEREKTDSDIKNDLWNEQSQIVQQATRLSIFETNGHTVVPLDDSSCDRLLSLMEKANGEQLAFSVMPYQIIVQENVPRWDSLDKNKSDIEKDMCRVKIGFSKKWKIDPITWQRWQDKFGTKYPKAIKTISDIVDSVLSAEKIIG
jgi:hypothetical protein